MNDEATSLKAQLAMLFGAVAAFAESTPRERREQRSLERLVELMHGLDFYKEFAGAHLTPDYQPGQPVGDDPFKGLDKPPQEVVFEMEVLSKAVGMILRGRGLPKQGMILADCVATTLAGVQGPDKLAMRDELLEQHVALVKNLIPVNEAIMLRRYTQLAGGTKN